MGGQLNPWLALPTTLPFVLPCDSEIIESYNAKHPKEEFHLRLDVLPEPFIGNPNAPVVLLNLNPGFDDGDPADHARPQFQTLLRNNYNHCPSDFPFYSLDPGFENGGRKWWEKKLKSLLKLEQLDRKQISRSILCVEYFPYHSRRFSHSRLELLSQEYGFGLVRSAMARGALLVIMRGEKYWKRKVLELQTYSHSFTLNSKQNVVVSRGNCAGFDMIVAAISAGNIHG